MRDIVISADGVVRDVRQSLLYVFSLMSSSYIVEIVTGENYFNQNIILFCVLCSGCLILSNTVMNSIIKEANPKDDRKDDLEDGLETIKYDRKKETSS